MDSERLRPFLLAHIDGVPGSFASTLDVIDALLRWERHTGGSEEVRRARRNGDEYLLRRNLFRSLRTGQVVNPRWASFSYHPRWHDDLLKPRNTFARRGGTADPRPADAIERVRAKRRPDGRWLLENTHPGAVHFRFEEPDGTPGEPEPSTPDRSGMTPHRPSLATEQGYRKSPTIPDHQSARATIIRT